MSMQARQGQAEVVPLLPFDALYAEVLDLAHRAQACLSLGAARTPDPVAQLIAICEATRLVSQLGFCLAWLLARRAVQSGELTAAAAIQPVYRLGGDPGPPGAGPAGLPACLGELLAESARVYGRIERLDRQLAARAGA